ncbi:recombinase family protein [Streptomyces sp. PTM05]|uniref:Recombinase family protein n=1 Tax=Streptantibioticus parmotrematis TaxID=2873249 RepID=A0ABS7QZ11_9ACTN|nr:recombinase family protein [Streptantibioticus parmotrematis]MBY8887884.1 recombinase family protein [Streptantibioticus parmotrematis]
MTAATVAYLYDRHATTATGMLNARMDACTAYLEAKGWAGGGRWLDVGDDALSDDRRPAFDTMLNAIHAAGTAVERVVLVPDWDRLSRNPAACGLLTRRVLLLGAWVETTLGEQRRPGASSIHRAQLNGAPITA